jgi:hypothetical protein
MDGLARLAQPHDDFSSRPEQESTSTSHRSGFEKPDQSLYELGRSSPVDHAVVATQAQEECRPHDRRPLACHHSIGDPAYGQDACLILGEDRREEVDVVHAEVADRESASGQVGRSQAAGPHTLHHLFAPRRDLLDGHAVDTVDDWNDQAVGNGDREPDVHLRSLRSMRPDR